MVDSAGGETIGRQAHVYFYTFSESTFIYKFDKHRPVTRPQHNGLIQVTWFGKYRYQGYLYSYTEIGPETIRYVAADVSAQP